MPYSTTQGCPLPTFSVNGTVRLARNLVAILHHNHSIPKSSLCPALMLPKYLSNMSFPLYSSLWCPIHILCWPLTAKVIFLKYLYLLWHYPIQNSLVTPQLSMPYSVLLKWCTTHYFSLFITVLKISLGSLASQQHCTLNGLTTPQCWYNPRLRTTGYGLSSYLTNIFPITFWNHLPHASLLDFPWIYHFLSHTTVPCQCTYIYPRMPFSCFSIWPACFHLKHYEFMAQPRLIFSVKSSDILSKRGWGPLPVFL